MLKKHEIIDILKILYPLKTVESIKAYSKSIPESSVLGVIDLGVDRLKQILYGELHLFQYLTSATNSGRYVVSDFSDVPICTRNWANISLANSNIMSEFTRNLLFNKLEITTALTGTLIAGQFNGYLITFAP